MLNIPWDESPHKICVRELYPMITVKTIHVIEALAASHGMISNANVMKNMMESIVTLGYGALMLFALTEVHVKISVILVSNVWRMLLLTVKVTLLHITF